MTRAIVSPNTIPTSALAELKDWLGISTAHDDALLQSLLRTSIEICADFTGTVPLLAPGYDLLPISREWHAISVKPVQSIMSVRGVHGNGGEFVIPVTGYALDLEADGGAKVLVMDPQDAVRIKVEFLAGLFLNWEEMPEAMRHGIIRLAAHQHREREGSGAVPLPPASVAALWRPWRQLRLA
jgi:uncharacterized phiE125 gp8 family phage protein